MRWTPRSTVGGAGWVPIDQLQKRKLAKQQAASRSTTTGSLITQLGALQFSATGVLSVSNPLTFGSMTAALDGLSVFARMGKVIKGALSQTLGGLSLSTNSSTSGASGPRAPTLGYPSPLDSTPTSIQIILPQDAAAGDVVKLSRSASVNMTSPTIATHTLSDADADAGTLDFGLSGISLSGVTYFQCYLNRAKVDSSQKSNVVAWGDAAAPVITTSATQSITETLPLAVALAATSSAGVEHWEFVQGSPDNLQQDIVGNTLEWSDNGTRLYNSPVDQGMDNGYVSTVRAVGYNGKTADRTITTSVLQADLVPNDLSITPVTGAARETEYHATFGPLAGVSPAPINIPMAIDSGEYSLDGGTTRHPFGSFVLQDGQSVDLYQTSSAGFEALTRMVINYGYTDSTGTTPKTANFDVTTLSDATAVAWTTGLAVSGTFISPHTVSYTVDFEQTGYAVIIHRNNNSNRTDSLTVGGVAATLITENTTGTTDHVSMWLAHIAATGNQTVQAISPGSPSTGGQLMFGVIATTSPTPTQTGFKSDTFTANPHSLGTTLNPPDQGIVVVVARDSGVVTWQPPMTEVLYDATSGLTLAIGRIAVNPTFTSGGTFNTFVAAVWGP